MKNKQLFLLVAISLCFVTKIYSQRNTVPIRNGFGILAGITQYDINTNNFITKSGAGFLGGLTATLDLPHKGYTVSYGMQMSENNIEISGRPSQAVVGNETLEYKLLAVQVGFYYHKKIFGDNLTIDIGPQLQYNGDLELKDETKVGYFINGYDSLTAKEIQNISKFNVNGMIGVSAGIGVFKVRAQYIYGFLNMLDKLNSKNLNTSGSTETKFKGNQSMLVFGAMFSF